MYFIHLINLIMRKIALYAWAFNPPTLAHKKIITWVIDNWLVNEVIFAPTGPRSDKSYWIENHFRERILEIFHREIQDEWYPLTFSDYFLKNKNKGNTTTVWMDKYFSSIQKDIELYHIFWVDVICQIPYWEKNEDHIVENKLKKIFIDRKWYSIPKPFTMSYSTFIDFDIEWISSTLAREMIQTKQDVFWILTPWVSEFIEKNWLYIPK